VARLLAAEKAHIIRFEKTRASMELLKEQCDDLKYKVGIAKTQLAKAQSQASQYLEWQTRKLKPEEREEKAKTNGEKVNGKEEHDTAINDEVETERRAAKAESTKRREQIEALEQENLKLNSQLTTATSRLTSLTDEDYAKTDLYITLKSQHEDVIKRINHLEATNTQLREEAQKLQSERSLYRLQVDEECRVNCADMESRMAHLEEDVQRLRSERDNAHMTKTRLEQSQLGHDESIAALKSLNAANEERVKTLESEIGRLKIQVDEQSPPAASIEEAASKSEEELRKDYSKLQAQYNALNDELSSMQSIVTRFRELANGKKDTILSLEAEVERLREAKNRMDLGNFAQRQAVDTKRAECENLRRQNVASAQVVSQLKDSEQRSRDLCANLEKQLAEMREQVNALTDENRIIGARTNESKIARDALSNQLADLTKALIAKDSALAETNHAYRDVEADLAGIKAKNADMKKKMEDIKKNKPGSNTDMDDLRVCSSLLSVFNPITDKFDRKLHSAIPATTISRTLSLKTAAT
jgi:E3 ubiquitin-protein ligase BRE1